MGIDISIQLLDEGFTVKTGYLGTAKYCKTSVLVRKEVENLLNEYLKDLE